MCKRTHWLNVGKTDFLAACKERRIGPERAESLWTRLDEIARAQEERTAKARADLRAEHDRRTRELFGPAPNMDPWEDGLTPMWKL